MKKLIIVFVGLVLLSCNQEPKEYVTVSGKIMNPHDSKTLIIMDQKGPKKEIYINADGTFSDTLKVEKGSYTIKHGEQYGEIYLENDYDLKIMTDYNDFDNTLTFEGRNADKSRFYIKTTLLTQNKLGDGIMDLPEEDFKRAMSGVQDAYTKLKSEFKDLDADFFTDQDKGMERMQKMYSQFYNEKIAMRKELPAGKASPQFINYENHDGSKTSLSDLKGKYVYIDVWATWCGPCIAEIPALKEVEKKYHDKNIEFVSISIDRPNAYDKWKKMVIDKELGGIQLLADNNAKSKFVIDYKISGIPRFILIDPDGNIINADAPRPSSPKLIEVFNELKI